MEKAEDRLVGLAACDRLRRFRENAISVFRMNELVKCGGIDILIGVQSGEHLVVPVAKRDVEAPWS
jgi:hypothetical protein